MDSKASNCRQPSLAFLKKSQQPFTPRNTMSSDDDSKQKCIWNNYIWTPAEMCGCEKINHKLPLFANAPICASGFFSSQTHTHITNIVLVIFHSVTSDYRQTTHAGWLTVFVLQFNNYNNVEWHFRSWVLGCFNQYLMEGRYQLFCVLSRDQSLK